MASKGKVIGLIILGVVLVIAAVLIGGIWYVGGFASPELALAEKGPYHYVYIDRTGPFTEIPIAFQYVDSLVKQQDIETGIGCGAYLDDPSKVAQENLRWRAGYIVSDSVATMPPLNFLTIDRRQYLTASINAIPLVSAFKTYPAIQEWLKTNPYETDDAPAYELYHESRKVEVLFPVKEKEE